MSRPGDLLREFQGARTIDQIAGSGTYDARYRNGNRREAELQAREGRTCETCSKPLSIYNPAPTCWACDKGVWREPRKGEWGG